ncbi:hypothetical protein CPB83DRAFT_869976 [Crepidotus variabilis]|uniref:C2H2-type domain-containing protein n=1 Tax=Crepidotus variabilis TaxID=179855 RepID=A0A9P6EDJ1_9AGAR|nr:hypothetical protein CPB83DRAFT_869976 [Crepidotus variabilis]
MAEDAPKDTEDPVNKSPSSPPRRPTTRSQTGTVAKRRTRDDESIVETKKRAPTSRKRQKVTATATTAAESVGSETPGSSSPKPPLTREPSLSSTSSTPALPSAQQPQLTFYHSSMSESDQPQARLPRSRASLPTPIPNLTKKSRGRRVPTKDTAAPVPEPNQKDTRLYVCTVEGCGKCFHRGEHLKRHIRSIHTHEKPFKCTFPLCEKFFNRHDNLLQHLKVHRQGSSLPDHPPTVPKRSLQDEANDGTSASAPPQRRRGSFSAAEEEEEEEDPNSPNSPPARPRTIYDAYPPRYAPFAGATSATAPPFQQNPLQAPPNGTITTANGPGPTHGSMASNDPMSLLTNVAISSLRMEVSSLRTEIPQSSADPRAVPVVAPVVEMTTS